MLFKCINVLVSICLTNQTQSDMNVSMNTQDTPNASKALHSGNSMTDRVCSVNVVLVPAILRSMKWEECEDGGGSHDNTCMPHAFPYDSSCSWASN